MHRIIRVNFLHRLGFSAGPQPAWTLLQLLLLSPPLVFEYPVLRPITTSRETPRVPAPLVLPAPSPPAQTSTQGRTFKATPQDHAVRDTIGMLGLVDLTSNLEGQPSHFPHQTDAAPSCIDVCYGDPTTIIRAEARYGPLRLGPTGHSPLHIRLIIPNLPPSPPEDADQGLPPPLKMPPLHDKRAWSQYRRP